MSIGPDNLTRIAVCEKAFVFQPTLKQELLQNFSHVTFNETGETMSGESLIRFLKGHDAAIVGLEKIDRATLEKLPELKTISKYGVGLDMLDLGELERRGIRLGWTGGVNAQAVAELTLGLALNIVRKIPTSHSDLKSHQWRQATGRQLSSLTVGILGCGHVGKILVKLLRPFGCRILAHDILDFAQFYLDNSVEAVGFLDLIEQADVLSVHVSKNASTIGLLSLELLKKMKSQSYLINTARGGIVDEAAVLEMLNTGHLAGAAFDVFESEPPKNIALIQHPNMHATSHIGGSTEEARLAMGRAAIAGLKSLA